MEAYIVAYETVSSRKERKPATGNQTPNTDTRHPSSWNCQSLGIQVRIDIYPAVSRSHANFRSISRYIDLLEGRKINGHSAGLARSPFLGCVTTALDPEFASVAEASIIADEAKDK